MKKGLLLILICILLQSSAFALEGHVAKNSMSDVVVYSNDKGKFGLKDKQDNIITEADYQKIIRLGETSWIIQKRNKFGIMDCDGNFIIKPQYRNAERILEKFVKLGNDNDFGIYDEHGNIVVEPEYSKINILFGGMFLTYKNYKYGVVDMQGNKLIDNVCDDIYMPQPNIMRVEYQGRWYEIEQVAADTLTLPDDIKNIKTHANFKITELITNPVPAAGYSAVTATDYFLKLFSSISPAYEETIDELMLSKGADTVNIFMRASWIPKFPFTYVKNYYRNVRTPNNGPLSDVKKELMQQMNETEQ